MSILKWVGGKRQLLNELDQYFPFTCNNYYEPFGGSMTVTLHVYEKYPNANIYVSDINPKLINLYTQLKKNTKKFLELLDIFLELKEAYGVLRDKFNTTENKMEEAVLMFLLNKKCFNGLYRVNKTGKFNVPEGKNSVDWESQKENIKKFSKFLCDSRVHISHNNFNNFFKQHQPKMGDLVYVDPPYWDTFTAYDGSGFMETDQRELCSLCKSLPCNVICSNSNTDMIKEIYGDHFNIYVVDVKRTVNRDPSKRTGTEVIMIKHTSPI